MEHTKLIKEKMKICTKCKIEKLKIDFYKNRSQREGVGAWCKLCANGYHKTPNGKKSRKKWESTPKGKVCREKGLLKWRKGAGGKKSSRKYSLKLNYGITLKDYADMLESQGGVCAICGTDSPGVGFDNFHVDHDHQIGKVRGLLCSSCNPALGLFKNNIDILAKAIKYLNRVKDQMERHGGNN